MTYTEYTYQPERANWFTKFLWHSAGADSQLLSRCPKSDQVKYECLGGLVLSTSVLAFMSGSYAIYVAFSRKDGDYANQLDVKSLLAAVVVGLFWSFVIYNIERFIVSSMGKVDETGAITLSKIWRSVPRIILSLIVGVVLAAPLEVRVLEKEVQQRLNIEQATKRAEYKELLKSELSEVNRRRNFRAKLQSNEFAQTQLRIIDLEQQIARKRANYAIKTPEQLTDPNLDLSTALRAELRMILSNPGLRSRFIETTSRDLGDATKGTGLLGKLQKETNRLESIRKNKKLVAEVEKVNEDFVTTRQAEYDSNIRKLENEGGLIKQLEIIHSDPKLDRISFFLRLLLIIIETSPIFFKMMVSRSTYEVLLDSQQRISSAQQGVLRGGLVTLDGRLVPTSEMSIAAAAYEAELRRRSETEARLADEVHRIVRERTAEDIREHPEDYYSRYGTSTAGTRHSLGTGAPTRYSAHTSGPRHDDAFGRRDEVAPSVPASTDGPSDADPGMGYVRSGGVPDGTSTGSHHVRSREEYERFIATTPTVETVVIPAGTSTESTEHRSGESSPAGEIADSSTSVGLSTGRDTSTFVTDDTTTSGSATITDVDTAGAVVDTASDSSLSLVDHETVVPPSVTDDMAEESLGHAEVVSPPALTLENTEGESTVSDFTSTDAGVTGSVDISIGVEGGSFSSGSLDDSTLVAREVAITESSESTPSASHSDESAERFDSEVSDSALSRGLLPTGAIISDTESMSTLHLAEGLPSDDSSSDDSGDVSDHGHPVPSDSIEPVS
jgi:hypothetical protein